MGCLLIVIKMRKYSAMSLTLPNSVVPPTSTSTESNPEVLRSLVAISSQVEFRPMVVKTMYPYAGVDVGGGVESF